MNILEHEKMPSYHTDVGEIEHYTWKTTRGLEWSRQPDVVTTKDCFQGRD